MTLEKIQKFLKNKHKFDHKPEMYDVLEKLDGLYSKLKKELREENAPGIKQALYGCLIDLISIANRYDIDLTALLEENFN